MYDKAFKCGLDRSFIYRQRMLQLPFVVVLSPREYPHGHDMLRVLCIMGYRHDVLCFMQGMAGEGDVIV